MKILISTLLAACTLFAPAATPTLAAARVAIACPADAPEAWKRPGGYCEQIQSLDTIGTEKGDGTCAVQAADLGDMLPSARLLLAMPADPCHYIPRDCASIGATAFDILPPGLLIRPDANDLNATC